MSTLIIFVLFFLMSCGHLPKSNHRTNSDDISGIQIGAQEWMAKNFDGVTFRNGDSIPQAKSSAEWKKAGKEKRPAWCYYNNDTSIGRTYGRMYNWYAVNDPRGLCPKGWHIPTNDEWIILEEFLGRSEAGLQLKCNGTTKFCATLGGYRGGEGGFTGIEEFVYLAGSTELKENVIWGRGIHVANKDMMRCGLDKEFGLYVRCIKD